MSVVCIDWETIHLHGEAWLSHHRLRYRLFVERQGWDVPSYNKLEFDRFDTPAAKYMVWLDACGVARGAVRLIPTTCPYMVEELWPELAGTRLPKAESIWEASRFGCDRDLPPAMRRKVIAEIICACQEFGLMRGITAYLSVMPVSIFKHVIAAAGCPLEILGPVMKLGRHPTAAAHVYVSSDVLSVVRRNAKIEDPVLSNEVCMAA